VDDAVKGTIRLEPHRMKGLRIRRVGNRALDEVDVMAIVRHVISVEHRVTAELAAKERDAMITQILK